MKQELVRTASLLGGSAIEKLQNSTVALFGLGGVGGMLCEALARAGVGALILVDGDSVSPSNINRQIIAAHSTVGRLKVDVMRERILDINPDCRVTAYPIFFGEQNADTVSLEGCNFIADAIDDVPAKLLLAKLANEKDIPIISAMGTGNKLDPSRLELTDITKTDTCPLARVMRRKLREIGISHLRVVYSREPARVPDKAYAEGGRVPPGSLPTVPNAAGLLMASDIINRITRE